MDINPYLKLMVEKDASDIFFTAGSTVRIKAAGKVISVGKTILTAEITKTIASKIMNTEQWASFEKELEIDFAIALPEANARFRVNAFKQQGQTALVMRYIKSKVPTLDELKMPGILKDLILNKRGLLLMVGGTNSGKSTTLAAMINHRNENQAGHILTIEDPIEFVHSHKKSLMSQRELEVDTHSYLRALRSAMRESPDVILIGEIRDQETMSAALELSNTGHLALSTLHANNAYQAMQRVINMFSQEQHKQLFMDLSLNLISVISQRLVVGVNKKRVAAVEVMINTPYIADLILKGKIEDIKEAMATSGAEGMQTFDMALYNLYTEGRVALEEALASADSRTNLQAKITFG
ncbi:MAG: type IV pili twitching motility protein PilT [Candidatus Parabeggiatoa sp. nov. 3]|nr:MAG: type IV pili twitching motility protein PilT [Gammaproteobacteria bacterium]RKZ56450.1 MAG: type IV pili twitching motility protein PilT [Gammaproteobacteria bacterium]RKZ78029.1 MAG: type IV pili twitching motility protein PilT [Gammaproteobacteria bacterium]HEW97540.1 PilT/PilU family type 4a pilus ATPase [Beggiatoa sp.]